LARDDEIILAHSGESRHEHYELAGRVESLASGIVTGIRSVLRAFGLCLAGLAVPAAAQVYELAPDGAMMVRDGGGAVQWRPVSAAAPASARAAINPAPATMHQALSQAASHHGLSPDLLEALVWQESRWHSEAVSPKGARGLTQLMPGTARALGVDAHDPAANLDGGAHYLRLMLDRYDGNLELALAAYNAGPARVDREHRVPAIVETRNYVNNIMARLSGHSLRNCVNLATCPDSLP
jgi:soluble lytic murein transglycosylase-like protein